MIKGINTWKFMEDFSVLDALFFRLIVVDRIGLVSGDLL
jgi:hypothetical protein